MKRLAAVLIGLSGFLVAGCFDIEQTLTLERNMSGKAGFTMKIDMEPMIFFMTQMKRDMEGKKGEPTKAELDAARAEFLAQNKPKGGDDFEKDKKEMESKLPKGVTLIDAKFLDQGLKATVNLLFGFDNASKLATIKFPKKADAWKKADTGTTPTPTDSPVDAPFDGLNIADDGKTILITSKVNNPMADETAKTPVPPDADTMKQIEKMFGNLRVAYKITAPFEILEHNATRKEGNTLIWEYGVKTLQSMKPEQMKQGVRVRYKK